MEEQKATPKVEQKATPKAKKLPDGWGIYAKMKLEQTGFIKGKKQVKPIGEPMKLVQLHEDQANELNVHKLNTMIDYVKQ